MTEGREPTPDAMTLDGYWREVAYCLNAPLARHLADSDPLAYRRMVLAYLAAEPGGETSPAREAT